MSDKFDIRVLTTDPALVACIVPAEAAFTWRSRSLLVPPGWMALVTPPAQDPVLIAGGGTCERADGTDLLFVRQSAVTCRVEEPALRSTDGHEFHGRLDASLRIISEPTDLAAFRRTIAGSNDRVTTADLVHHLAWGLRQVLVKIAAGHTAEQLLSPVDPAIVRRIADEQVGGVCLAGGLIIDGPVQVRFESPAYLDHRRSEAHLERHKARQEARSAIQAALASARQQQMSQLVELLEKLRDAGAADRDRNLMELLKTFDEAQRGQMYAALWHLNPAAARTRFIAVVSGEEVLLFEPARVERPARRIRLPNQLGPLRSIRISESGAILVGAAHGVHVVDMDSGRVRLSFQATAELNSEIRGGVNATAMTESRVFATHSEQGLLSWALANPGAPAESWYANLTDQADAVRGACVAEGLVWFTADQHLWAAALADGGQGRPQCYRGSDQMLSAVTIAGGSVYAGNVIGEILAWDVGEPESPRLLRGRTGEPVGSLDLIEAGGVERLVVADRSNALAVMVVGDVYSGRYEAHTQVVRRAAAAEDVFAAMNDARDRLLVWSPVNPREPAATVIIPHLTGAKIQDLCLHG